MVNLSSISARCIIIQHYSLHIAPVMVNFSSLGCSYVFTVHRGTCVLITSEIANLSSLYVAPAWFHKRHGIQKFHLLSQESNGQSAHNSHRTNLKDAPKTTL